jgi:hypothetical protein
MFRGRQISLHRIAVAKTTSAVEKVCEVRPVVGASWWMGL